MYDGREIRMERMFYVNKLIRMIGISPFSNFKSMKNSNLMKDDRDFTFLVKLVGNQFPSAIVQRVTVVTKFAIKVFEEAQK